jgi:hypothetical protein
MGLYHGNFMGIYHYVASSKPRVSRSVFPLWWIIPLGLLEGKKEQGARGVKLRKKTKSSSLCFIRKVSPESLKKNILPSKQLANQGIKLIQSRYVIKRYREMINTH